ncbi:MAG: hypothetical protein PHR06_12190, partial [Candidatus Cloacimonetes bacterium]|nr:hypothetical protein [Candidatus Cloacimonadota bacterium]
MEYRYLKDFVIILSVIILISFAFSSFYMYQREVKKNPVESVYANMALDDQLMSKIHDIENSISDRKNFVFNVEKD